MTVIDTTPRPTQEWDDTDSAPVHERNQRMRAQRLELTLEIAAALASGDTERAARLRERRGWLDDDFVRANYGLAVAAARPMLRAASAEDSRDHEAEAVLGLWEAYVGTDSRRVDDVEQTEDGVVRFAAGWDGARATFGTHSRAYAKGRVTRSVARIEAQVSYTAWSQKPAVEAAAARLQERLGRTPTAEQVAEESGVTAETVTVLRTPRPTSLDAPAGGESDAPTLLDTLQVRTLGDAGDDVSERVESALCSAARDGSVRALDLYSLVLRDGLAGRAPLSGVETGDVLGIGRGQVNTGTKRAMSALTAALSGASNTSGHPAGAGALGEQAGSTNPAAAA